MQIKNEFIDFIDDIIEFVISSKKEFKYVKNVPENKKELEELIIANNFNFFNSINYYKNSNYSINFKYTDIDNFHINDMYYWKNNYLALPNMSFTTQGWIDTINRRKERFMKCINNNIDNVLLIYMDKLQSIKKSQETINNVRDIYDLPYKLLYIIPTSDNIDHNETKYPNITFLC